jgi:HlyD family secretion protein
MNENKNFFSTHHQALILMLMISMIAISIWFYSRPKPIAVEIYTVKKGLVEKTVVNTRAGTVNACRRAKLSPSVGGQITELPIKKGDMVKQGQLLLSLWNKDLIAQVDLASNEIIAAKNNATSACLQAKLSHREANRLKQLRKNNAVSEERLDEAVTLDKIHASNCQSAEASVAMGTSQLHIAQALLEKTRLLAPFDGIIGDISAELSEYVTPSPVGVQTLPVIDLINNNCFYVSAPIDEVDMPAISVGLPARITLDAFGDHYFQGEVRRIAAYVVDLEKQARTVDVEVNFIELDDYKNLLAGYSADVEIIIDAKTEALRIPSEALMEAQADALGNVLGEVNGKTLEKTLKKVWVYKPDTKTIDTRKINTGLSNWSYTQVLAGLELGEKIILSIDREGLAAGAEVDATNNSEEPKNAQPDSVNDNSANDSSAND